MDDKTKDEVKVGEEINSFVVNLIKAEDGPKKVDFNLLFDVAEDIRKILLYIDLYNMEKRNIVNSIIIDNNRIDLTPYFGKLDEDSHVISWKALGYMAKPVKGSLIIGEEYKKYSVLPKGKKYAARFPKFPLYTNEEGLQFVSLILSRSNFAKAGKVLFVLYRKVEKEYKLCGVVTEEF